MLLEGDWDSLVELARTEGLRLRSCALTKSLDTMRIYPDYGRVDWRSSAAEQRPQARLASAPNRW
jgi:hypothetical protein